MKRFKLCLVPSVLFILLLSGFTQKTCRADCYLSDGNMMIPSPISQARVRLDGRNMPGREALDSLFSQAHAKYVFDEQLDFTVTMKMSSPIHFETLLEQIANLCHLDFRIDAQGVFHCFHRQSGSGVSGRPDLDTKRFFLKAKEPTPVRSLLTSLFQEANIAYEIDLGVTANLAIEYSGVKFREALRRLLMRNSGSPLTFRVDNGKYIVYPRPQTQ